MRIICIASMVLIVSIASAQTTTWKAGGAGFWNNAGNWTNGVPVAGGTVIFDATSTANCTIDIPAPSVTTLSISAGYTGNIDLNGTTLTVGPGGNHTFLGGTFTNGTINISGNSGAEFDGTDLAASVTLIVDLTSGSSGVFEGDGGTVFGGPVTVTAHSILLNGSTYNDLTTLTKSSTAAAANSIGEGGNWFKATTTISNATNAVFRTANASGDTFDGQLNLSLDGTSPACKLELAYGAGTSTAFNNNIRIRTDNTSTLSTISGLVANNAWISFGQTVAPGSPPVGGLSTLAFGFTIQESAGANIYNDPRNGAIDEFFYGDLILNNFTQSGSTAQSLNLRIPTSDASIASLRLLIRNSTFNGNVTFSASNPYISGSTFNGLTNTLTKTTGSGTDSFVGGAPSPVYTWDGGNTFNNTTTIDNRGQCTLVLGGTTGDTFNGNVTFNSNQDNSHLMIAQTGTTEFKGNITLTQPDIIPAPPSIQFGYSGGAVIWNGSALQTFSSAASVPSFGTLTINNSGGIATTSPFVIRNSLTLTSGIVTLDNNDYVSFLDNATVTGAKDAAHINGVVRKTGNDAFTFPIGDDVAYNPLAITAPTLATSEFSAEYRSQDHGVGSEADGGLVKVSDCEYWLVNRLVGSENVTATLYWNDLSSFCHANYITDPSQLQVARWSGALWNNLQYSDVLEITLADGTDGHITTLAALPDANFHALTLGSLIIANALPISLISFDVIPTSEGAEVRWETASEKNNYYYTIERLQSGEFIALTTVPGAGTTLNSTSYAWIDGHPLPGLSYYRLKQTDFDGTESYSEVSTLMIKDDQTPYPNPVHDVLHLSSLDPDDASRLIVTDVSGQVVYSGEAHASIDFSSYKPGIYHLRVTSKNTVRWYSVKKE